MQTLTWEQMQELDGEGGWGDFFTGVACSAAVLGGVTAAVYWPEPVGKWAALEAAFSGAACLYGVATM